MVRPRAARWLLVLGHGAGAGMRHPFMERVADALAGREIGTFRYQFPYLEAGRRRPDPAPILCQTVRAAISAARKAAPDLLLLAGGKSLGGRMTSTAASRPPPLPVKGLVFLGFPLHPAGRPSTTRAEHLDQVSLPMLFLQGTRDRLAKLDLLQPVLRQLGERAVLHIVEGGDHSFGVLKRSGRTSDEVFCELAANVAEWTTRLG